MRNHLRSLIAVVSIAAMVSGCAGFGGTAMGGLSTDQIKAAVQDKSSAAGCSTYTGTGGQFQVMFVNNDKTFGTGGGKTTVECGSAKVTFEDAGKAATTAKVPISP